MHTLDQLISRCLVSFYLFCFVFFFFLVNKLLSLLEVHELNQ